MAFRKVLADVMSDPIGFFTSLREEKGYGKALATYSILVVIYTLGGMVVYLTMTSLLSGFYAMVGTVPASEQLSPGVQIAIQLVIGFYSIGFGFVSAAFLYLWFMVFGYRGEYEKVYHVFAYASVPALLLGWIPFVSWLAGIWTVILGIIGAERTLGLSRTKAILAYVIPIIIAIVIVILVAGVVLLGVMTGLLANL